MKRCKARSVESQPNPTLQLTIPTPQNGAVRRMPRVPMQSITSRLYAAELESLCAGRQQPISGCELIH